MSLFTRVSYRANKAMVLLARGECAEALARFEQLSVSDLANANQCIYGKAKCYCCVIKPLFHCQFLWLVAVQFSLVDTLRPCRFTMLWQISNRKHTISTIKQCAIRNWINSNKVWIVCVPRSNSSPPSPPTTGNTPPHAKVRVTMPFAFLQAV